VGDETEKETQDTKVVATEDKIAEEGSEDKIADKEPAETGEEAA